MIPSIAVTEDGLNHYLKMVHQFPILEEKEEYMLAKRWRDYKDCKAVVKLVNSHLRLVTKIAAGYRGYGLPFADLIAEGNIGILQALKKFDPEKGYRFSTYARWWIQASIQEYILKSWSIVKVGSSAAQKKLFFNLRRLKSQLGLLDDKAIPDQEVKTIADELNVSEKEVRAMDQRFLQQDASLNKTVGNDSSTTLEWQDWIPTEEENQEDRIIAEDEKMKKNKFLEECIHQLKPREFEILQARRLTEPPKKLEELSEAFHISKERVRQIEMNAFKKLQEGMRKASHHYHWALG